MSSTSSAGSSSAPCQSVLASQDTEWIYCTAPKRIEYGCPEGWWDPLFRRGASREAILLPPVRDGPKVHGDLLEVPSSARTASRNNPQAEERYAGRRSSENAAHLDRCSLDRQLVLMLLSFLGLLRGVGEVVDIHGIATGSVCMPSAASVTVGLCRRTLRLLGCSCFFPRGRCSAFMHISQSWMVAPASFFWLALAIQSSQGTLARAFRPRLPFTGFGLVSPIAAKSSRSDAMTGKRRPSMAERCEGCWLRISTEPSCAARRATIYSSMPASLAVHPLNRMRLRPACFRRPQRCYSRCGREAALRRNLCQDRPLLVSDWGRE